MCEKCESWDYDKNYPDLGESGCFLAVDVANMVTKLELDPTDGMIRLAQKRTVLYSGESGGEKKEEEACVYIPAEYAQGIAAGILSALYAYRHGSKEDDIGNG